MVGSTHSRLTVGFGVPVRKIGPFETRAASRNEIAFRSAVSLVGSPMGFPQGQPGHAF
jgi:hypothetical protein